MALQYLIKSDGELEPYISRLKELTNEGAMDEWITDFMGELDACLVFDGDKVVGWAAYIRSDVPEDPVTQGEIGVFVEQTYRGQGAATQAVDTLLDHVYNVKATEPGEIVFESSLFGKYKDLAKKYNLKPREWETVYGSRSLTGGAAPNQVLVGSEWKSKSGDEIVVVIEKLPFGKVGLQTKDGYRFKDTTQKRLIEYYTKISDTTTLKNNILPPDAIAHWAASNLSNLKGNKMEKKSTGKLIQEAKKAFETSTDKSMAQAYLRSEASLTDGEIAAAKDALAKTEAVTLFYGGDIEKALADAPDFANSTVEDEEKLNGMQDMAQANHELDMVRELNSIILGEVEEPSQELSALIANRDKAHREEQGQQNLFPEKGASKKTAASEDGWIVTRDHLDNKDVSIIGPSHISEETVARLRAGEGEEFRLKDADGNLYYSGRVIGDEMAPLDDYGQPNAGATTVEMRENGVWKVINSKGAAKSTLPSTQNTPEMQQRVLDAFWSSEYRKTVERPNAVYEHGHWWITGVNEEGETLQWDAVDASGPGSVDGFGFEQV